MSVKFDLLRAVQSRVARAAVAPSAVRGRGMAGVVEAARTFLRGVPLAAFGTDDQEQFMRKLDGTTARLQNALPADARYWGVARKIMNIFLRDSAYTVYLRESFSLDRAEPYLEVPLDSVTAGCIIAESAAVLSAWCGVKNVTPKYNQLFQREAAIIASSLGTHRVHLDAHWWSVSRDSPVA